MALTRDQFQELRDKGLSVQQIISFEAGQKPEDITRQKQVQRETGGNQFAFTGEEKVTPEETTKTTGIRDFLGNFFGATGLGRGIGTALAAPGVQKTLSESQRQIEEMQKTLIARIKEKRTKGEDISRLQKALKDSQASATSLQNVQSDFLETIEKTKKETVGSAVRLAGFAASGTIASTASKAFALGRATTFAQGALRGAGVGAVSGGIFGGIQGLGTGIAKDEGVGEAIKETALGAGIGALAGAPLGALAGGVQGSLQGKALRTENFAKELVAPKETAKVRAEAIQQGRLQDPTLFEKASLRASKRDELLAKSVEDVVSPKASIGENVDAIRLKVSNTNAGVEDYITNNKIPFNTRQLQSKLESGKEDLRLIFASDKTAEKTYDAVAKEFMRIIGKKDTLGLFQARQEFDQIPAIKKLLETDILGENARKEIVLAVRRAANEYVAHQLPIGNQYRELLMNEHYMLEALGNLAEKSVKIIGKNKLQILTEQYPVLKWLVGGIAAGLAGAAGIGVGGAIIGSTD